MLNKKVLLSILIIGAVVATAGAATWATLSDSRQVNGDITAGELYLGDQAVNPISVAATAPGDSGTEEQLITIGGNLDGILKIDVDKVNVPTEANTSAPIPNTDKLGEMFKIKIKLTSQDGTQTYGYAAGSDTEYALLSDSLTLSNVPVDSGATYKLVTEWQIDALANNGIQGQTVSFDEVYTLESRAGTDRSNS
ncbi:TasA family protein [Methanosarcina sp. UBA289]|uniref:TasA family protein n=1 Tax=Methanosarcina sp. UBA289 TaxID=1915574 RepID=UPI0026000476|nr:TasA family protein [Methanosarcina sp. UBA289]